MEYVSVCTQRWCVVSGAQNKSLVFLDRTSRHQNTDTNPHIFAGYALVFFFNLSQEWFTFKRQKDMRPFNGTFEHDFYVI